LVSSRDTKTSLSGQAFNEDQDLVEELMDETDGDEEEAERRFRKESAGAPRLDQER
jgi:hypothetical protein